MGHQFIGLMLLILAVAGLLYGITHYPQLLNLKIEFPALKSAIPTAPSPADIQRSTFVGPVIGSKKSVRIASIRLPDNFNRLTEFSLSAELSRDEFLDITGWSVKTNGGLFAVPQAQEVYSFGGAQRNINLRFGDRINFYSGIGPKGNFRINKCMGYIEDFSPFTPPIDKNCPLISRQEMAGFSSACQTYLSSLRACQNPNANPPVPVEDTACHEFLRTLNYVGCADKYRNDSDFLENEWRVWLGDQIKIFDPVHDKVQLLDKSGKVMAEYIY